MTLFDRQLRTFAACESGAVTVDWVVLSGGVVGVGLAALGLVSTGVEDASGNVAGRLSGFDFRNPFASLGALFATDFSAGADGWFGGTLATVNGFGEVLVVDRGTIAEMSVDVPADADSVTLTFDLIAGDDMDGDDQAVIYINDQAVALYTDDHGNITTSDLGVPGVGVTVEQQYSNDPVGGGSHGNDSRAGYTLVVSDPGETLTFGIGSEASAEFGNEFFAIDDVNVSAQ